MLLLVLVLGLLAGCGRDRDNWPDGTPKIDDLTFVQQSPQDPYALEFLLLFSDTDGDTGSGTLFLEVGGSGASDLPMSEIFANQTPPVALDAVEGEFEVVVRLKSGDVAVGDRIRVGFVIEDAAGNESNDPWIAVEALAE